MILLFDVGNTHTHLGLASAKSVRRQANIPTGAWKTSAAPRLIRKFIGQQSIEGAALCSVVPAADAPD